MKLRKLSVRNFRGIKEFDWLIDKDFVCLVGPGDSTKTTILDAIGIVLSSRYSLSFTDADFYQCDSTQTIEITATVIDLPDTLIEERSHGKNRSGIRTNGDWEHDPLDEDGVDECLIVRLTVDQTLEPVWEVIRPGDEAGDRITATERSQLGFFRIGDYADTHLRWSRGSALSSLTSSRTEATYAVVEAQRQARSAISTLTGTPLHEAATAAMADAVRLGSAPFVDLRPGLDPTVSSSTAALVLHEGNVPLTSYGLGSRRLTSLAIQENALSGNSMLAIDEIEYGLDPHRLLHLVRYLRKKTESQDLQVFVTTHSSLVLESLSIEELFVVSTTAGVTAVATVPAELSDAGRETTQGLVRKRPSALLARRVIVGEGATETGMIRLALEKWDADRAEPDATTALTAGTTVMNGEGDSQAPDRATALARLGYPVFLMIDGDVSTNAEAVQAAADAGVEVLRWAEGEALEDIVVKALDIPGLQKLITLAVDENSSEGVRANVGAHLGVNVMDEEVVVDWILVHGEGEVRTAIAKAAKGTNVASGVKKESSAWFKREDRGERLGELIFEFRESLTGTDLAEGLSKLKIFANPAPGA